MTDSLGGKVQKAEMREYGKIPVKINNNSKLFKGIADSNAREQIALLKEKEANGIDEQDNGNNEN